jgi:hypothetical protein
MRQHQPQEKDYQKEFESILFFLGILKERLFHVAYPPNMHL